MMNTIIVLYILLILLSYLYVLYVISYYIILYYVALFKAIGRYSLVVRTLAFLARGPGFESWHCD